MSGVSTHILDTATGRPAVGINVRLFRGSDVIGSGSTDADGRIRALLAEGVTLESSDYRIQFEIGEYFAQGFYPEINIAFTVRDTSAHYHVPLLISPFGYTTYRGS